MLLRVMLGLSVSLLLSLQHPLFLQAFAYTCYQTFARTSTGLAPDSVSFGNGEDFTAAAGASYYRHRPETMESLFVLNQLTGDPIYR